MIYFLIATASLIIGGLIIFLILRPKLKSIKKYDEEIDKANKEAEINLNVLTTEINNSNKEYQDILSRRLQVENEIDNLNKKSRQINEELNEQNRQAEQAAKDFYNKTMTIYSERIDSDTSAQEEAFQKAIQEYKDEYTTVMNDCAKEYKEKVGLLYDEYFNLQAKLEDLRSQVNSAIDERKRAAEMKDKEQFYKIQLSDEDKSEIKKIKQVIPYLRNPEAINKAIWSVYYQNPTNEMIGRVIGTEIKTGIYKITNLEDGRCYVGQAANVRSRWIQHIKRGLGAETPTLNKLYPAMNKIGPENFTFELLEECSRELLDSREDYWQDYYSAIDYGYSIK